MAATIRGKRVVWGIPDAIRDAIKGNLSEAGNSGIITGAPVTDNADESKIPNEVGDPVSQVFSGRTSSLTIEVVCEATTVKPEPGDLLDGLVAADSPLGWTTGIVVVQPGVQTKFANKEAKSFSIPVIWFPEMVEPEA
ncbi:MAG: hypothetical protein IT577_23725 [Verrucomicrobiae bacterium]|nr:hypothetical protein [Verrucomicrobiae bacterium]